MSEQTKEIYFGTASPEHLLRFLKGNPDSLDLLAVIMVDLFIYGSTSEQQARANKAREVLEMSGMLKYSNKHNSPSLESVKELLRKMVN